MPGRDLTVDGAPTGLGLAIIARVADRLELSDATPGTRVRMTFAIGARRGHTTS